MGLYAGEAGAGKKNEDTTTNQVGNTYNMQALFKVKGDAGLVLKILIHGHLQAGEYAGEVGAAKPR